jgi:predicted ATP-grasp superfamily ATP-dependent carboligase
VHCAEWLPYACALLSRSCSRRLRCPNLKTQPDAYRDFILAQLRREDYACLLAMEEDTLLLLSSMRAEVERYTAFPFAPAALIAKLRDKTNLEAIAGAAGLNYPKTTVIQNLEELRALGAQGLLPLVLKPALSSGARGLRYLRQPKDIDALPPGSFTPGTRWLVQEYIAGESYGASCLLGDRQEWLASFVHRRVRSFPVPGGPSTLAESVAYPALAQAAYKLLAAQQWSGVAMVEFKVTAAGQAYLIEVNPRFWGSLALPIACGVNFPYLLYKSATGQEFEPVHSYLTGQKLRWFFPGDMLHFISNPERLKLLPEFFALGAKDTRDGIFSWQDPLPLAGKLLSSLYFLSNPELRRSLQVR